MSVRAGLLRLSAQKEHKDWIAQGEPSVNPLLNFSVAQSGHPSGRSTPNRETGITHRRRATELRTIGDLPGFKEVGRPVSPPFSRLFLVIPVYSERKRPSLRLEASFSD